VVVLPASTLPEPVTEPTKAPVGSYTDSDRVNAWAAPVTLVHTSTKGVKLLSALGAPEGAHVMGPSTAEGAYLHPQHQPTHQPFVHRGQVTLSVCVQGQQDSKRHA
jgi:hypothetical protein